MKLNSTFVAFVVFQISGCVNPYTDNSPSCHGVTTTLPVQENACRLADHGIIEIKCVTKLRKGVGLEVAPALKRRQNVGSRNLDVSGQTIRTSFDNEGFAYLRLPVGEYYLLQPNAVFGHKGVSMMFVSGPGYDLSHLFNVETGKVCTVELFIPVDEQFDGREP